MDVVEFDRRIVVGVGKDGYADGDVVGEDKDARVSCNGLKAHKK